ncbi:hypothetical protein L210DRAFT_935128 [Boletus edulis BED1]|uniref:Uncharacterized protein n=1 Tax=Boletus edulis BED1 TaxID=1328754 RepID=A0AAD4BNW5_BOLED|nr:hypothetical protein L210DRAFT_935128 [Boletus edulis BED1]
MRCYLLPRTTPLSILAEKFCLVFPERFGGRLQHCVSGLHSVQLQVRCCVSGVACRQGTTPSFSIAISSAQDASNVIKWATANNVKLTIKILSLTHGLNSVTCNLEFVPKNSSTTRVPVLTIGAGAQLSSIYEVAGQQNVSAVLGACPTVGVAPGRRARRSGDTELRRLNMSYDSSDVSNVTRNLN